MRTLFLCGAGNPEGVRLALRVNEATHRWDRLLLLDDDVRKLAGTHMGVPVAGTFDRLRGADPAATEAVNLVSRTCAGRRRAGERIAATGIPVVGLVSTDVDLLGAAVAPDLIAYQNATIGPEATVAAGCVVFMGAAVGHESQLGQDCVIAANAVLNARVVLGDGVYVGSNATVLPEITVGAGAVIGAGATVIDDVPAGATVVGPVGAVAHAGAAEHRPAGGHDGADIERELRTIWAEVLGTADPGPDRNFFDIGGTSLLALRMLQRAERSFGVTASALDFFEHPTLHAFAGWLAERRTGPPAADAAGLRLARRREALGRL